MLYICSMCEYVNMFKNLKKNLNYAEFNVMS